MLIVVAVQGCGVSGLGAYGNEWIATPCLDRFALESEVFDRHYSPRPCPIATRQAWWANLPADSCLIRNTRPENTAPSDYTEQFKEIVDATPNPADPSPMDAILRQLTAVLDRQPALLWIDTDQLLPPWTISQSVFEVYLEELTDGAEPDFSTESIPPWVNPQLGWFDREDLASWELLHRSYAAAVTGFDADLGRIFEVFRSRGLAENSTWAFTSDYGFPLGQHGLVGPYRPYLHDEFVHVPLIVRRPSGKSTGRRSDQFTLPEDVLPILSERAIPNRESVVSEWAINGSREAALRTKRYTFLLPLFTPDEDEVREPVLFEMPDDRWEVNNIRQANLDLADEMEAALRTQLTGPSS